MAVSVTCLDDSKDERADMKSKKDQLASDAVPNTRNWTFLVSADARHEHVMSDFSSQCL